MKKIYAKKCLTKVGNNYLKMQGFNGVVVGGVFGMLNVPRYWFLFVTKKKKKEPKKKKK